MVLALLANLPEFLNLPDYSPGVLFDNILNAEAANQAKSIFLANMSHDN